MQEKKFKADEMAIIVDGYTIIPYTEIDEYFAKKAQKKKNKLLKMFNSITLLHDSFGIINEDSLTIKYASNGITFSSTYGGVKKILLDRYANNPASEHEQNLLRILRAYLKKLECAKNFNDLTEQ